MRFTQVVFALALASSAGAQGGNPEVFVIPVSVAGTSMTVGKPANITNRQGYDNQPSFSADGRTLFYTSTRDDGQADIYAWDVASRKARRLTATAPESEYSATVMPGAARISVIRVERDSTQRLWSFDLRGGSPDVVLADVKPVGYHAWVDAERLALFVLGTPNALVLANRRTGTRDTLARDIGRSLLPLPEGRGFSFVARHGQQSMVTVARIRGDGTVAYIRPAVALMPGMDYVAWLPGGRLVGGAGTRIYLWPGKGDWIEVADLAPQGLTRISRLALSPDRRMLAVVAEPARP